MTGFVICCRVHSQRRSSARLIEVQRSEIQRKFAKERLDEPPPDSRRKGYNEAKPEGNARSRVASAETRDDP
jgi:hypothetical protein